MMRVELASRAVLYVDARANLSGKLVNIKMKVSERIFTKGLNALDRQMIRAMDRPFGKYRYRTGKLLNSLMITQPIQGMLIMAFNYPDPILAFLQRKYGPIFAWSPSDVAYVQTLVQASLEPTQVALRPSTVVPVVAVVARPGKQVMTASGFDFTTSSNNTRIDVGEGTITVRGRIMSLRGARFEVQPRGRLQRYDSIQVTPSGLEYVRGANRPVDSTGERRVLFIIFVPSEELEDEEVTISEQLTT